MIELGVWSDWAGGFIDRGFYTNEEAQGAVAKFVADGEDPKDLSVLAMCGEHEEQPLTGCEECDEEEAEED